MVNPSNSVFQPRWARAGLRALRRRWTPATTPTTTTSPPTSSRQPNVQTGFLAKDSLAIRSRQRLRPRIPDSDGLSFDTGIYGANLGNTITTTCSATSTQFRWRPREKAGRCCCGSRSGWDHRRTIGPHPCIRSRQLRQRGQLFHPDYPGPVRQVLYLIGLQGAINRLTAIEVCYVGNATGGRLRDRELERNQLHEQRVPRRVQAAQQNLQSHIAAGCGRLAARRAPSPTARGNGTPPDLPRRRSMGSTPAPPATRCATRARTGRDAQRLAELADQARNPGGAASTLYTTAAFRTAMTTAGYPRNFFVLNPDVEEASVPNQRWLHEGPLIVVLVAARAVERARRSCS